VSRNNEFQFGGLTRREVLAIGAVLGFAVAVLAMPKFVPAMYTFTDVGYGPMHVLNHPARFTFPGGGPVSALALLIVSGMMIAELVPVPLQIFWVKVFKKKLFTFTPIHHGFEKKGWSEGKVVQAFALSQLAMSLLAIGICAVLGSQSPSEFSRDASSFTYSGSRLR